jgi:hypothetical protein
MLFVSSLPSLLLLVVGLFFVPESPRFLLVHGEVDKALALLQKAAEWNHTKGEMERMLDGRELCLESASGLCDVSVPGAATPAEGAVGGLPASAPQQVETSPPPPPDSTSEEPLEPPSSARESAPSYTLLCDMAWDVELGPELLSVTRTLCALFFLMAFVYYALILLTVALVQSAARQDSSAPEDGEGAKCKPLEDSEYVSIVWANAGEIPGLFIAALLLDSIGRKRTIAALFLVAGAIFFILALDIDGLPQSFDLALVFCARAASLGFNQSLWVRESSIGRVFMPFYPRRMHSPTQNACALSQALRH